MKKKSLLKSLLLLLLPYGLYLGIDKYNDKFAVKKMTSNHIFEEKFITSSPSIDEEKMLKEAFSQKYYYLGHGAQIYPFLSEDGKYVIKFIKYYKGNPPKYSVLPLPKKLRLMADKTAKRNKNRIDLTLDSFVLTDKLLKNQTGLIYAHLNKTNHLQTTIKVQDKLKRTYDIDLDKYEFLVQHRANLVYDQINMFMKENNKEKANVLIDNILTLIEQRLKMGIYDDDISVFKNIGAVEEKAVFIDFGRFRIDRDKTKSELKDDLVTQTDSFHKWLKKHHPPLATFLEQRLKKIDL